MSSPSPFSTPKRKHSQLDMVDTARFAFETNLADPEDGSNSPRTRVAHKFRDLALDESGGGVGASPRGVGAPGPAPAASLDEATTRKRVKLPSPQKSPSKPRRPVTDEEAGSAEAQYVDAVFKGPKGEWATGLEAAVDPVVVRGLKANTNLQRSYPSINRLAESKSRHIRTSPLVGSKTRGDGGGGGDDDEDAEADMADPFRASLTWHEDEITVYDPDDEDDDGTGINGIGFKPTPAMAHARTVKRRQQMAEYKKREDRDARAKRSQRRRGDPDADDPLEGKAAESRKAVHFTELESQPLVTT